MGRFSGRRLDRLAQRTGAVTTALAPGADRCRRPALRQMPAAYRSDPGYRRVDLSATRGRGRIWGPANPRYWASLDPGRPGRSQALILDLGRWVRPFMTPDDPDAVESAIRENAHVERTGSSRAPIV